MYANIACLVRSVRGRIPDLQGDVWRQTIWEAGHRGWHCQRHIGGAGLLQAPIMFWQTEERGTGCEEAAPRLQRQVLNSYFIYCSHMDSRMMT